MIKTLKISIFTEEDFTDKKIIDFLAQRKSFSVVEYSNFLTSFQIYNALSDQIINFIAHYDDGILRPDKCNAYEPINKHFNLRDISEPISWLSQPGGAFYFKKSKGLKIEGAIENQRFAPIWSDGRLLEPTTPEPLFLGEIKLFVQGEIARNKGIRYWKELSESLCRVSKTQTAILQLLDEGDDIPLRQKEIMVSSEVSSFFE